MLTGFICYVIALIFITGIVLKVNAEERFADPDVIFIGIISLT
jgi:hypothetical protein